MNNYFKTGLSHLAHCFLWIFVVVGINVSSAQVNNAKTNSKINNKSTATLNAKDANKDKDISSLPIDLKSDSGSYDKDKGIAIYEGNVIVMQGGMTIKADKLTIYLKDNQAQKLVATANTGKLVVFDYIDQDKPIHGQAQSMEYVVADKLVTLHKQAMVKQELDVIHGDILSYKLDSKQLAGSRIKMRINPAQKK